MLAIIATDGSGDEANSANIDLVMRISREVGISGLSSLAPIVFATTHFILLTFNGRQTSVVYSSVAYASVAYNRLQSGQ